MKAVNGVQSTHLEPSGGASRYVIQEGTGVRERKEARGGKGCGRMGWGEREREEVGERRRAVGGRDGVGGRGRRRMAVGGRDGMGGRGRGGQWAEAGRGREEQRAERVGW